MNPPSDNDDDLLAIFSHARRCDRADAPVWRPELLDGPRRQRPVSAGRWRAAILAAASALVLAVFLFPAPSRREQPLSEALPPLLDSPPGELFASLEPSLLAFESPSDFLLSPRLTDSIP